MLFPLSNTIAFCDPAKFDWKERVSVAKLFRSIRLLYYREGDMYGTLRAFGSETEIESGHG